MNTRFFLLQKCQLKTQKKYVKNCQQREIAQLPIIEKIIPNSKGYSTTFIRKDEEKKGKLYAI